MALGSEAEFQERLTLPASGQSKLQFAQIFHAAGDFVASFEPNPFVLGTAEYDPFRRACENYVACLERHVSGNVGDKLRAVKDEIVGAGRLSRLTVNPALNFQFVGIHLIRSDQIGAQGSKLIQSFANHPLAASVELELPRTKIVPGRITRYK